jgi:hypothetical protein
MTGTGEVNLKGRPTAGHNDRQWRHFDQFQACGARGKYSEFGGSQLRNTQTSISTWAQHQSPRVDGIST